MKSIEKRTVLEDAVRQWLESQSPHVKFLMQRREKNLPVDFLVTNPAPIAIEILAMLPGGALIRKAKRLLAQRISLAERFGPAMPWVVVVPPEFAQISVPFADLTIAFQNPPSIETLVEQIKLDSLVQSILQDGSPNEVTFSRADDVERRWEKSIGINSIWDPNSRFRTSTLASKLRDAAYETLSKLPTGTLEFETKPIGSTGPPTRNFDEDLLPLRSFAGSAKFGRRSDEIIHAFLQENLGGRVVRRAFGRHLLSTRISVVADMWESSNGKSAILRRIHASVAALFSKTLELNADAWMIRAFAERKPTIFLLLLGIESEYAGLGTGIGHARRPLVRTINQLEAGGWVVVPWDFAEREPEFLGYLESLTGR